MSRTCSIAATAMAAIEIRSCGRFIISEMKPAPSSPSRFALGTATLSKNSSAVSWAFMPTLSRLRPRSKPSIPRSTTSRLMPLWPASGSVRQTTITRSARMPLLMKVLEPLRT